MRETQYKGLTIRDDGTVINKFGNEIGKYKNKKGYSYLNQCGKNILKHRLIWEAFNGEIPDGMEIDHIIPLSDGGGNELSNLRLVTSSGNKMNPRTLEKYKISNKGKITEQCRKKANSKRTKLQRIRASMNLWMVQQIKRYHKNGNVYEYQD